MLILLKKEYWNYACALIDIFALYMFDLQYTL